MKTTPTRKQTSVVSRIDDLSVALRNRWWAQGEQGVPEFGFILVLVAVVVLVLLDVVGSRANNCLSGVCSALGG